MNPENNNERENESSISSDLIRGHINTIILRTLYDGDKYGYEIINEIEEKSKGQYSLKQPTLYSALKRLEGQDYVTSYWGGASNGGRRKYFQITDKGKTVVEQNLAEWEYSRTVIDSLISQKDYDFSNPPPSALDFSLLKKSTTRIPSGRTNFTDDDTIDLNFTDSEPERILPDEQTESLDSIQQANEEVTDSFNISSTTEQTEQVSQTSVHSTEIFKNESETQNAESDFQVADEDKNFIDDEQRQRIHENYKKLVGEDEDAAANYYNQATKDRNETQNQDTQVFSDTTAEDDPYLQNYQENKAISAELLYSNKSPAERNYKALLSKLYDNSQKDHSDNITEESFTEESAAPQPQESIYNNEYIQQPPPPFSASAASNIEFYDIQEKADSDGIKVTTSNGTRNRSTVINTTNSFDKGKVLFKTAVFVFIIALAESIINLLIRKQLNSGSFYIIAPFLISFIGFGVFLFLYLKGYGKNSRKSQSKSFLSASLILFGNLVLIICLIAYLVIFYGDTQFSFLQVLKYAILPCIFVANIPLFAFVYNYNCNKE